MPISVQCPGCGKNLKGKDELAGKRVKCPKCGLGFTFSAERPQQQSSSNDPPVSQRGRTASLAIQAVQNDGDDTKSQIGKEPNPDQSAFPKRRKIGELVFSIVWGCLIGIGGLVATIAISDKNIELSSETLVLGTIAALTVFWLVAGISIGRLFVRSASNKRSAVLHTSRMIGACFWAVTLSLIFELTAMGISALLKRPASRRFFAELDRSTIIAIVAYLGSVIGLPIGWWFGLNPPQNDAIPIKTKVAAAIGKSTFWSLLFVCIGIGAFQLLHIGAALGAVFGAVIGIGLGFHGGWKTGPAKMFSIGVVVAAYFAAWGITATQGEHDVRTYILSQQTQGAPMHGENRLIGGARTSCPLPFVVNGRYSGGGRMGNELFMVVTPTRTYIWIGTVIPTSFTTYADP